MFQIRDLALYCLRLEKCSLKHKIGTQEKFLNHDERCKAIWAAGGRVNKYIGYDAGETRRISHAATTDKADKKYKYHYPLYDIGCSRAGCVQLIKEAGLPLPGKSSCYFCPSMKKKEIEALNYMMADCISGPVKTTSG